MFFGRNVDMSGDKYGLENPTYTVTRTPKIYFFTLQIFILGKVSRIFGPVCPDEFNSNSSRPRKTLDDDAR